MIGFKYLVRIESKLLLILLLLAISTCNAIDKSMEVNDIITDKIAIKNFVLEKFEIFDSSHISPIFPFKINYESKSKKITFCNLRPIESWALKKGNSYTFFLALKNDSNLVKIISENYGVREMEGEVEIDDQPGPTTYFWRDRGIQIILRRFPNINQDKKFDNCVMVIIGNMKYQNFVYLGEG